MRRKKSTTHCLLNAMVISKPSEAASGSEPNRPGVQGRPVDLGGVAGGHGGVGAPGWCAPLQDAWFRLLERPPVTLFAFMVVPAERGEVAFAGGPAVVPGGGVVQVAAGSRAGAAGGGA